MEPLEGRVLVLSSRWGDSSGTWYRFHMLVVLSLMYWVSDIMCSTYALSDHCCQSSISYCTYRWLSMLYIHEASVAEKFCPRGRPERQLSPDYVCTAFCRLMLYAILQLFDQMLPSENYVARASNGSSDPFQHPFFNSF